MHVRCLGVAQLCAAVRGTLPDALDEGAAEVACESRVPFADQGDVIVEEAGHAMYIAGAGVDELHLRQVVDPRQRKAAQRELGDDRVGEHSVGLAEREARIRCARVAGGLAGGSEGAEDPVGNQGGRSRGGCSGRRSARGVIRGGRVRLAWCRSHPVPAPARAARTSACRGVPRRARWRDCGSAGRVPRGARRAAPDAAPCTGGYAT